MKLLITVICVSISFSLFAQYSQKDTIYPVKVNLGYKYYQNGKLLRMADLTDALATNKEADSELNSSKSFMFGEYIFSIAGGFLIGYELGGLLAGNKIDWRIMGPGLGAVAISIPFSAMANKKKTLAVKLFNDNLKKLNNAN